MTPEGWKDQHLSDLAKIVGGGTPTRSKPDYWDGDVPWATPSDVTALLGRTISETASTITDTGLASSSATLLPPYSLLMTTRATIGACAINEVSMATNQGFQNLVPKQGSCVDFLYYLIRHHRRRLVRLAAGSTFLEVSKRAIRDFRVRVPPLPEQHKIAAIVSSVDNTIENTQAVIDQVQVVKRGLMQELLTRGLPGRHTRFKQTHFGEIPEEWDSAPLGSRAELQPGFAFKSRDFSADGDRLLRGSNVGVGRLVWSDDKTKYFPSERREEVKDYELQEGDIVVAMDRPFVSDGFKIATMCADDLPALLLQRVGRFRRFRRLARRYLWQLLQSSYVKTHLQIAQKGTDLPHISKTEIESSICPFPPVDEQERIATRLGALDIYASRLEQERQQISLLKASLMSVLLTGELRVTPDTEAA